MSKLSVFTFAAIFIILYFKGVSSAEVGEKQKEEEKYASSLWFGPRVGRRKRNLMDEPYNINGENLDVLLDFIRKSPWTIMLFNRGRGQMLNFSPKSQEGINEASDLTEVVERSMFAPRLGRASMFAPRLGRDSSDGINEAGDMTEVVERSMFAPRLGRASMFAPSFHIEVNQFKNKLFWIFRTMVGCIGGSCFRYTITINRSRKSEGDDEVIGEKITFSQLTHVVTANGLDRKTNGENGITIPSEPVKPSESPPQRKSLQSVLSRPSSVIYEDENGITVPPQSVKPSESPPQRKSLESVISRPSSEIFKNERRRSGVTPVRIDQNQNDNLPVYIKDKEDERLIRAAIEKNDFLSKIITKKRMDDVVAAMYNKEIAPRDVLIRQGDKGSHMYVSAMGKFQTIIKGKVVEEFEDVRVFGELSILYNAKRLATIKAITAGRVWVLDSSAYHQIVIRDHIKNEDETMNFLMNNGILNVVGNDALRVVANLLKTEWFSAGTEIVRQGDKGHKFYIIRAGTVTITKDMLVVGVYKKGDCFGELALLEEDCRQATVTANSPGVECLTLTRREFIDHLGAIKTFKYIKMKPKDSIKPVEVEHEELNLLDLKIRKTLGVGGFGRVELVQHTVNENLVFALKYLKKVDVIAQGQEQHVYNEKDIQMACRTPFIVRLYRTYKDQKYIYFLMECCLGGDLWSLLQRQKNRRFEEKEARFICACVLEAYNYLHSRGIIYRDLKPENLLISLNGYIKLTDFGFAKKLPLHGKTFTFAGTPEYVAPEIVLNRGHDKAVDYWAYGVFIFEMLTGKTPFRTDDSSHMRTYNKILSGIDNIPFPTYVTLKSRHLIEKLCRPVPSDRLGMNKGGIQEIRSHKWYLGFDWQAFSKCEMPSPFKPKLASPIDTKYFDQFKKDNDTPPDELSGWDEKF
ncbi:hypothetical protein JTB14_027927 [Gonioctena quinquepunctata]|nr:hypothetical protein JTB14_027927 [Gonioctena quinquepunctata]